MSRVRAANIERSQAAGTSGFCEGETRLSVEKVTDGLKACLIDLVTRYDRCRRANLLDRLWLLVRRDDNNGGFLLRECGQDKNSSAGQQGRAQYSVRHKSSNRPTVGLASCSEDLAGILALTA